jgi:FkbM family methyltransferase
MVIERVLRLYTRYAPTTLGKRHIVERAIHASRKSPATRIAVTKRGVRLLIETDDLIQGYIYLFGVWEPNITDWVTRTLRPGDTFVDVGSNIGYYSTLASRLVGSAGSVVAIDASSQFSAALQRNVELNANTNVRVVNIAAANRSRTAVPFYQPDPHNRGHTTGVPAGRQLPALFTVAAATLPEILTQKELERARIIKIDVEGMEFDTLQGLVPAFSKTRPDIELIVEISPDLLLAQGHSAAGLIELLGHHGFNVYRIMNDYTASSYLDTSPPSPPRRWTGAVTELGDFVFSMADVESL